MHELLAKIDDTTYKRIIEDARMKGIEPWDWINRAINEFLAQRRSVMKEVPASENDICPSDAVHVHAELYTPHPEGDCHDGIEQLKRKVRELETERDNLKLLIDQKSGPDNNDPLDKAEVLYLTCQIEKNAFELDGMEMALERLRLERDRLLSDPENSHTILHIEKEINRQQYEVDNFREEIAKFMSTRDTLREEIAKKQKE